MAKNTYKTKIVLIDAHAILHRAYHALPDFSSSKGEPTGGLYGLASMMMRIISELKPDYIFACYDRAETTFRKQIYEDYKAGRAKAEPELIAQIIRSRDIFSALHIPIYDLAGFEADDIIGTIVEKLKNKKDAQVIIASGDMDTLQLVDDDRVVVFTLKKGLNDTVVYNEKMVRERYGFEPKFLVDYKGLRGDPSDNIIGVEGIGEKTATTLIQELGTIEDIYKQIKKDEQVLLDRGIKARIIEILKNSEEEAIFSKTLATIRRDVEIDFQLPKETWVETFETSKAEALFSDLEFRTLILRLKKILSPAEVLGEQRQETLFKSKADEGMIKELAIALWLLNSDQTDASIEDILTYTKTESLDEAKKKILADLETFALTKVFQEIELPLIPILARAEIRGIKVDPKVLSELSSLYHQELSGLEKRIYQIVGQDFNINSPKQLGEILFSKLQLSTKGLKKTAGGSQSTRESELIKLQAEHPIINKILSYRELQKLLSTYIDNLPKLLDHEDVLHPKLHQTGTSTGRLSSSSPNIQNIPNRGDRGLAIRRAFVAREGYQFISFDYSQIELRVLAVLAKDPELIRIFKAGEDIHTSVAARVFGVSEEAVDKEMRRRAKIINFGIIYGMGVNALKVNLGTSREEAQKFMTNYFDSFPAIKNYFDTSVESARRLGYTETLFGRRRYLPALKSPLPQIKASAERMAMNAPVQGTAADIIKMAMIKTEQEIKRAGQEDKIFLLFQIHDELLYEVAIGCEEEARELLKKAMEEVLPLPIPLVVSRKEGINWGELGK